MLSPANLRSYLTSAFSGPDLGFYGNSGADGHYFPGRIGVLPYAFCRTGLGTYYFFQTKNL
jgi:hypothetical protein